MTYLLRTGIFNVHSTPLPFLKCLTPPPHSALHDRIPPVSDMQWDLLYALLCCHFLHVYFVFLYWSDLNKYYFSRFFVMFYLLFPKNYYFNLLSMNLLNFLMENIKTTTAILCRSMLNLSLLHHYDTQSQPFQYFVDPCYIWIH